jgi:ankyrin repeat protein
MKDRDKQFIIAAQNGDRKQISKLHSKIDDDTLQTGFLQASVNGRAAIIKMLVDHIDDPSVHDKAFITACTGGHQEIVSFFLKKGIDPSMNDQEPLLHAVEHGKHQVVRILLEDDRVDPSVQQRKALIMAMEKGHKDILAILLIHPKLNQAGRFIAKPPPLRRKSLST